MTIQSEPVKLWLGLLKEVALGDGVPQQGFQEVRAPDYKRVLVELQDGISTGPAQFAAAASEWGWVTHFGVYLEEDAAEPVITGELTNSVHVGNGDTAQLGSLSADEEAMGMLDTALKGKRALTQWKPPADVDTNLNETQRTTLLSKAAKARHALGLLEDDE